MNMGSKIETKYTHSLAFDSMELLDVFTDLSEKLISVSYQEFIEIIPKKACKLLSVPICIIWQYEEEKRNFNIISSYGKVDGEYKKSKLNLDDNGVNYLFKKNQVLGLVNVNQSHPPLSNLKELNKRKWTSLLTTPLVTKENRIIGILNVFTYQELKFADWQKKVLEKLANYIVLSFKQEEISNDRKLQVLSTTMLKMMEVSEANELWDLLEQGTSNLVGSKQICIGKLDYLTGRLNTVFNSDKKLETNFEHDIYEEVLALKKPKIINNISEYCGKRTNTSTKVNNQSKLILPVLIERIPIREQTEVKLGSKVIGLIDIEHHSTNAFSKTDEERLWLLARYAAMVFERLELDRKLHALRNIEIELTKPKTYEQIIAIVINSITDILDFEWVNISIINPERTMIQSKYVRMKGWSKDKTQNFKKKAKHSLSSNDIQADIVKRRQIEVPKAKDKRFDDEIYEIFEHNNLVRVYIPMISSFNNLVIGTVEVGYNKKYRENIYEQDVQVLKYFVDNAVHALERKKSGFIDILSHELKSPIIGIRNNASYIQRRLNQLHEDKIRIKFDDILMDCTLLLYQVRQIEHFMGQSVSQKLKFEKTIVFRDIVVKTINQLKTTIEKDYGFPPENIEYYQENIKKINIYTDRIKLSQVVYNLIINSIRYAEKDPKNFRIRIDVSEDKNTFTLKFKDWGIGIKQEDKDNIFKEGFRSQAAIAKDVRGSGLGLTISRGIMKQLGGELILWRLSKPTEFHVVLPK